jgi:hypothetical protein
MQVLFTIELRVACDNDNKYIRVQHAIQQATLQAYAKVGMIEGDKPEVVISSHDFEKGHRDVPLMENDTAMAAMSMRFAAKLGGGTQVTRRLFLRGTPSFLMRAVPL